MSISNLNLQATRTVQNRQKIEFVQLDFSNSFFQKSIADQKGDTNVWSNKIQYNTSTDKISSKNHHESLVNFQERNKVLGKITDKHFFSLSILEHARDMK